MNIITYKFLDELKRIKKEFFKKVYSEEKCQNYLNDLIKSKKNIRKKRIYEFKNIFQSKTLEKENIIKENGGFQSQTINSFEEPNNNNFMTVNDDPK